MISAPFLLEVEVVVVPEGPVGIVDDIFDAEGISITAAAISSRGWIESARTGPILIGVVDDGTTVCFPGKRYTESVSFCGE